MFYKINLNQFYVNLTLLGKERKQTQNIQINRFFFPKQEEQMLRQLTFRCKTEKKIVLIISLDYTLVTQSAFCLIFL